MPTNRLMLIVLQLLINWSFTAFCQSPSIRWQECYGGSYFESVRPIKEEINNRNSFTLVGATASNDGNVNGNHGGTCSLFPCPDSWILKIDTLGNLLFQKCIGGSSDDGFESGIMMSNGNLLLCGATSSNDGDVNGNHSPGLYDGWLVECDSTGTVLKQHCYGGSNIDLINDLILTSDSGIIIVGGSRSNNGDINGNHGNSDVWILRLDSAWNILWSKCYGGSNDEDGRFITSASDSEFIIGATTQSNDGDVSSSLGGSDYWIFKIDNVGNVIWEKSLGGSQNDILQGMIRNRISEWTMIGYSASHDGNVSGSHDTILGVDDIWVVQVDSGGNFQWQKCFGGTREDIGNGIIQDFDNGFIICGTTSSNDGDILGNHGLACFPYPCDDIWLCKIDSIGNLQWQKCLGGSDADEAIACTFSLDTSYLMLGTTFSVNGDVGGSFNHGNSDSWALKLSFISLDASMDSIIYPTSVPICDTIFSPKISIRNNGYATLYSVNINYQIDTGLTQVFYWNGMLLHDSIQEVSLPSIYVSAGNHSLHIFLNNTNGGLDGNNLNDTLIQNITVLPFAIYSPIQEGFESAIFPPVGWQFIDANNIVSRSSAASGFGNSSACLEAEFYAGGNLDVYIISPDFDMNFLLPPLNVIYSIAYVNKDSNSQLHLTFGISTDCGLTFYQPISLVDYSQNTTGLDRMSDFNPISTEWRVDSVDLTPYLNGYSHVRFAFELFGQNTNNLYLDDINIIDANTTIFFPIQNNPFYCYAHFMSDKLYLKIYTDKIDQVEVKLLDIIGRIHLKCTIRINVGLNIQEINTEHLTTGIYFLQIENIHHSTTKKLIVR
ncbi:MAG: choice-of-anchor J domain-containing protein [Bacteroidota bacterium]